MSNYISNIKQLVINKSSMFVKLLKKIKERKFSYIIRYVVIRIYMVFYIVYYHNNAIIVFESNPNMSDNTKAIYDEMLKRRINSQYIFVWITEDDETKKLNDKNCYVISTKNIKDASKAEAAKRMATCIICSNSFIYSTRKECKSYYLNHGIPVKNVRNYYNCPQKINYVIVSSEEVVNLFSYSLNCPKSKIIPLGAPRNDAFYLQRKNLSIYFGKYKKYIIWYPTFRQHKLSFNICDSNTAIPLISNEKTAKSLNEAAAKNQILIIIKPHFAQNVEYIKRYNLSNVIFIDDLFFVNNKITSYEMLASSDALITDYSSVYFDYLLCNKPIGLIWNDIDEYKKNPGLIDNYEYYLQGGIKIYKHNQLISFIEQISNNKDELKIERNKILNEVFKYKDNNNTNRVTNFIINESNIKM